MKTKPTQHAVRTLSNAGIQADFIVARGRDILDKPRREKLAFFCWMKSKDHVVSAPDMNSIYDIPAWLEKQRMFDRMCKKLNVTPKGGKSTRWDAFVKKMKNAEKKVKIAVVGKYFGTGDYTLADSYISVIEAAKHAGWANGADTEMTWVDSEKFEENPEKVKELKNYDAVIVPGGFGTRGVEGIITAIKFVRENKIPYLGLCYGMQLASIEFARNVMGLEKAHTLEFDPKAPHLVININHTQEENVKNNKYGGTMRLGAYNCRLRKGTKVQKLYKKTDISERHRHRYEFNNDYRNQLEEKGMQIAGINEESNLVEIIELEDHPYYVGCQFHPEFKSRPLNPHPLFMGLLKAAVK